MDAHVLDKAEELAKSIAGQATTIEELNAVMRTMMKSAPEKMLGAELNVHLQKDRSPELLPEAPPESPGRRSGRNRRNGTTPKSIQGDMGKIPLDVPRDRDGTFDPCHRT